MARQFIYHMSGLNKAYGNKKVLENIHLSFYPDAKIGILGPNGAGKSTVLRIMAGLDKEFTGEAWLAEGATCGYLPQEPELDPALNVMGNVMEGVAAKKAILDRYNELMMNYSDETAEEGAQLQDIIDAQNLWDLDSQVEMAMEALRCPPPDATIDNLSGGEKRRLHLLSILMQNPNFLILDEPTNDLDVLTLNVLEDYLMDFPGVVLIVTHDRYFMDKIVDHLFIFEGEGKIRDYNGTYTEYRTWLREKQREDRATREPDVQKSAAPRKGETAGITYQQKRQMDKLEREIATLETRKAAIHTRFAEETLASEDIVALSKELDSIQQQIEEKELAWMMIAEEGSQ